MGGEPWGGWDSVGEKSDQCGERRAPWWGERSVRRELSEWGRRMTSERERDHWMGKGAPWSWWGAVITEGRAY